MRGPWRGAAAAALLALGAALGATLAAGAASAQTGLPAPKPWPEPSRDAHDLNGVYMPESNSFEYKPVDGGDPPWTAEAHADFLHRRQAAKDGKPVVNTSTLCLPSGMPKVMTAPYPIEVVSQPRQVIVLHEIQHLMRFIYLNEQHPEGDDLFPTYAGHSVGSWEGDVLVVDTVATTGGLTTLDQADRPKSGAMHIVEHIRKIDGGRKLEDLVTFDDPKVYTRPWTARLLYDWRPDIRFIEYICEENMEAADPDFRYIQVLGLARRSGTTLVFRNRLYAQIAAASPQLGGQVPTSTLAPMFPLTMAAFSQVRDVRLREIAWAAHKGAVAAYRAGANRLALAGFGGSLEAMLLDLMLRQPASALGGIIRSAGIRLGAREMANDPASWNLVTLIKAAPHAGGGKGFEPPQALREWRNLIHPAVAQRNYRLDSDLEPEARSAANLHEILLRDLP